jgi:ankyrin repeat protein
MIKVCRGCHANNKNTARYCNDCGTRFLGESPARNLVGCGSIFEAMKHNDLKLMKKILRRGCQVGIANGEGYTPLHWAAEYGHTEMVRMLIVKGADINVRSYDGWTPLDLARAEGHKDVEELIAHHMAGKETAGGKKRQKAVRKKS